MLRRRHRCTAWLAVSHHWLSSSVIGRRGRDRLWLAWSVVVGHGQPWSVVVIRGWLSSMVTVVVAVAIGCLSVVVVVVVGHGHDCDRHTCCEHCTPPQPLLLQVPLPLPSSLHYAVLEDATVVRCCLHAEESQPG